MNRTLYPFIFLAFLLVLVFFDAFQQKFYVDTFALVEDEVPLTRFIQTHSIRWAIWLICAMPLTWFFWLENRRGRAFGWKIITALGLAVFISVLLVTAESVLSISDRTFAVFWEHLEFFFYQKGLVFLLAYLLAYQMVKNYQADQLIHEQVGEIEFLKKKVGSTLSEQAFLKVKTGFRLEHVPVEEIRWIEADDYCCKVHTKSQVYTIRKSLKSFEAELLRWKFVRVHRKALVNLDFLGAIHLQKNIAELTNGAEVPLSRHGARNLKQKMESTTIVS